VLDSGADTFWSQWKPSTSHRSPKDASSQWIKCLNCEQPFAHTTGAANEAVPKVQGAAGGFADAGGAPRPALHYNCMTPKIASCSDCPVCAPMLNDAMHSGAVRHKCLHPNAKGNVVVLLPVQSTAPPSKCRCVLH
jgi:hypothetical protein